MLLLSQRNAIARVPRRLSCRRLIRNEGWWHKVWTTYSDVWFKKTLRVSRATFHFILSRVGNVLQRQTVTEEPISPEERLGICLYSSYNNVCSRTNFLYSPIQNPCHFPVILVPSFPVYLCFILSVIGHFCIKTQIIRQ